MKAPHKKLLALLLAGAFSTVSWASSLSLESKVLTLGDLVNVSGSLYYIQQSALGPGKLTVIRVDPQTVLQFTRPTASSATNFTAIHATGEVVFQNDPMLSIKTDGLDYSCGIVAASAMIQADALTLSIQNTGEAMAIDAADSSISINGRFSLASRSGSAQGLVLRAKNSDISLISTGHSTIDGHIEVINTATNTATLGLSNPTDRWMGRAIGNLEFTLKNGATWITDNQSTFKRLTWGAGGVLDLENSSDAVQIRSDEVFIENGAVLKVDLAHTTQTPTAQDLSIGQISNATDAEVLVYAVDSNGSSAQTSDPFTISLEGTGAKYVSFKGVTTTSDNPLYTQESTPVIAFDNNVWSITGVKTEVVGPSTLMEQQLDFYAASTVAHEQLTDRSVFAAIDRAIDRRHTKGHWVDVNYGETELDLHHGANEQTLKTASFEMGFDREVTLPYLTNGLLSVSAAYARSDVTMDRAEGDIDQWALNIYAGGITSEGRRLLLGAHYQYGTSELNSVAWLGNQKADFSYDRQVWGVSAYLGFIQSTFETSAWHIEPFMMGTSYWIKSDSSQTNGMRIKADDHQQSIVRLGTTIAYRAQSIPVTWRAQGAWVHRFGRSIAIAGTTAGQTAEFDTHDLKESWGEVSLEALWAHPNGMTFSVRGKTAKSHDVKPQYQIGFNANYIF